MDMSTGQFGYLLFFCISTFRTGEGHHTFFSLCRLFGNCPPAKHVNILKKPHGTAFSTFHPVGLVIILDLGGFPRTVIALCAVVFSPRITFHTDSMTAAKVLCFFGTACFTQLTVITSIGAALAGDTFFTQISAVCTNISAVCADRLRTVAAVMTVLTHCIGTIDADTAVRTEFIDTAGTFSAVRTNVFAAVLTDNTALLTDFGTISAQAAILAEAVRFSAFDADITGSTEFVAAIGAFLLAFRANIRTLLTTLSTRANKATITAQAAIYTKSIGVGTIAASTTVLTNFIRAVGTGFSAFRADVGTVGAAASAGADHIHAVVAKATLAAEVFLSHAVYTIVTVRTEFVSCAVFALLIAFGTDRLHTLGATISTDTNILRTHLTGLTAVTEISLTACTVLTDIAASAYLLVGTVGAFFTTIRTDGGTVGATVSTYTNVIHTVFTNAAFRTIIAFSANAVKTDTTFAAELVIGTGFTFFSAVTADQGTFRAAVSANTEHFHTVYAQTTLCTVVSLASHTFKARLTVTAELIVGTGLTFFAAFRTDDGTVGAASSADTDHIHTVIT